MYLISRLVSVILVAGALAACTGEEAAPDTAIALSDGVAVRFTSAEESAAFLSTEDDFIRALSPADLQVRFGNVDASYLDAAEDTAKNWTPEERARVSEASGLVRERFEAQGIALPFPQEVRLMRTTGAEEGYIGGYTRGDAIIFPDAVLEDSADDIAFFIAHELFHVATRQDPTLRDPIYAIFGFEPCGVLQFPPDLFAIKLTNPDAHHFQHCVQLSIEGEARTVMPMLTASAPPPDADTPMAAVELRLLAVSPTGEPLRDASGALRFHELSDAPSYFEAIGANTDYIIHPEEIAADNFALMVLGVDDRPNPEFLEALRATLTP